VNPLSLASEVNAQSQPGRHETALPEHLYPPFETNFYIFLPKPLRSKHLSAILVIIRNCSLDWRYRHDHAAFTSKDLRANSQ